LPVAAGWPAEQVSPVRVEGCRRPKTAPLSPVKDKEAQAKTSYWVHLSTVADSRIGNPPWLNIESVPTLMKASVPVCVTQAFAQVLKMVIKSLGCIYRISGNKSRRLHYAICDTVRLEILFKMVS
jgi:hypothetical protein